jgi:DNA repair exonuclease SbcCD nuclease subunit
MPSLRFLQISDLHLESSLAASQLALPPAKQAELNRDILRALDRAVQLAVRLEVEVVLVPGDVWDDESVSFQAATRFYEALGSLSPVPVIIAPGNHDSYHPFSYHHPQYFERKCGRPHPPNITVFGAPRIECLRVAALPDVDFHGCCHEGNVPRRERILSGVSPRRKDALNLLLLHGSRDDSLPEMRAGRDMTAPFSRDELLAAGFDYAALGHYHRFSTIADDAGRIRAAYCGVPVARGLDEAGDHGVIVGDIDKGGVLPDSFERVSVDPRRILRVEVEIDPGVLNGAAAQERIANALVAAGVQPQDIVVAALRGRTHPEAGCLEFDPEWLEKPCFHLVVDQSALEPDHDLDRLLADGAAGRRVEGAFARRMVALIDAEQDPHRRALLRAALSHGLDALQGREVRHRCVH